MENNSGSFKEDFHLNERQIQIIKALRERSVGRINLANMYIGGLKVLLDKSNPDRFYQSAHSLRELVGYLTNDVEVITKQENEKHREKMRRFMNQEDVLDGPTREYIDKQWYVLHNYFVDVCHHHIYISQDDEYDRALLKLEFILTALFCPVYESLEEIEKIAQSETPTEEDLDMVISLIKKEAQYRSFIRNINHPNWFLLLKEEVFKRIPQKGEHYEESRFLTKIADKLPQEVAETIRNLSNTDHEGAQVEFMNAILKMPIEISKTLKKQVRKWIINSKIVRNTLFERVVNYIIKLFENDEIKIGIELARAILYIKEDSIEKLEAFQSFTVHITPEVNVNIDPYSFERYINKFTPILKEKAPIEVLKLYSQLLNVLIRFYKKNQKGLNKSDDLSFYWRKLINENDNFSYNRDIKNVLVNAIRELLVYIGENQEELFDEAISILRKNEFIIFQRLELFIIRDYPKLSEDYIEQAISNKEFFDLYHEMLEYPLLLKQEFSNLTNKTQNQYLKWIKSGPNIRIYRRNYKKVYNKKLPKEDLYSMVLEWQVKRLGPIKEFLDSDKIKFYRLTEEAVKKYDIFNEHTSGAIFGPSSPISYEEMVKKSKEEIITFLLNFKMKSDFFDDSISLGRVLRDVVEQRAVEFSSYAGQFIKTESLHRFISFFLDGMKGAIKQNQKIDWVPIMDICESILIENVEISEEHQHNKEITLKDIKTSIGSLIQEGLSKEKNSIPFSIRDKVWLLIKILLEDKSLTEEKELNWLSQNGNLWNLAINSIRGIAFNSMIQYGIWHADYTFANQEMGKSVKTKMPSEVKEILEDNLIIENEPSLTIRSIYGENLNRLMYLDKNWVIDHINDIFPQEKENQKYWEASWASFISFNRIYKETYDLLKEQYNIAIDLISKDGLKTKSASFSIKQLGYHIVSLLVHGIEDISNEESLIHKFFKNAPSEFRSIFIHYLGQHLQDFRSNNDSKDIITRLKQFWDYRITEAKNGEIKDFQRELTRFVIWFENSIFEKEWILQQFEQTLEITQGSIDVFYDVIDSLLDYVEEYPVLVMKCIDQIIKHDIEVNKYLLYIEKYNSVLKKVFQSRNQQAIDNAKEVINYLVSRDYDYFRGLLRV